MKIYPEGQVDGIYMHNFVTLSIMDVELQQQAQIVSKIIVDNLLLQLTKNIIGIQSRRILLLEQEIQELNLLLQEEELR